MTVRNGLGDRYDVGTGAAPVDLADGAVTGKRLAMRGLYSVDIVFVKGAGTADEDPVLTLKSHTAGSSGTSANLAVITEYYVKTETTLDNDETWTKVTQAAAATVTRTAEAEEIVVFTVSQDDLPVGHTHISVDIASIGAEAGAQLGTVLYITHPMDKRSPDGFPALLG